MAGHELKGAVALYDLNIMSFSLPLVALVDYRFGELVVVGRV